MPAQEEEEADDAVVRSAIASTLGTCLGDQTSIRSNKLRKMVCKQIPEATWTQFARCLESVLKEKEDAYQMDEKSGNITIQGSASAATGDKTEEKVVTITKKSITAVLKTKNVKVPRAIALHLTRKGHKKKHNIEVNTKTKLTIHGIHGGTTSLDELVTIQIDRPKDGSKPELDTEELAAKHVRTAELLLQKMADSYKKHPDRFAPKVAGGTLEEQQQYAQEKEKAGAVVRKKKNKRDNKELPQSKSHKKRKKEKFY